MTNKNNYTPQVKITEIEIASVFSMIAVSVIIGFLISLIPKEPNWLTYSGLILIGSGIIVFIIKFWTKFFKFSFQRKEKRSKNDNDE